MKNKVIVITGPTASGKTKLSLDLAERFDGEIVSADSMQVYKGMDIGTAKPTKAEMRGIPHHMIDIADPTMNYTLADYLEQADLCVKDILSRDKTPFIVGGTGLYISSFVDNVALSDVKYDESYRRYLNDVAIKQGGAALRILAEKIDPEATAKLHDNDTRRLARILEIYKATGKTKTELDAISKEAKSPYDFDIIGLNFENRDLLYSRIDTRVDEMISSGLENEVRSLRESGLLVEGTTAAQAIGYRQFIPYFEGKVSFEQTVEDIKRESRRYAKRQLTWFRRDEKIQWSYPDSVFAANNVEKKTADYAIFLEKHVKSIENFLDIC